jgi:hypothetical protein
MEDEPSDKSFEKPKCFKKIFQLETFFTPKPNWPLHFILEIKEGIPNLHLL